jgi:peptidoglycan/LPS O-acetylase OafA/YrhL
VSASRARGSIRGFDGLRALAALAVLSYHVSWRAGVRASDWFAPVLWELKGGVAIFFVISGALLYLPYARAMRDRRPLPGWRGYARRRAVRILPAYWVALTAVAIGPFGAGVLGADAGRYYGLSQIYDLQTAFGGLKVAWSLCVEVTFYALLPVFARVVGERASVRVQLGLIGALGAGSLVLRGALAGSLTGSFEGHGTTLMVSLPGMLDWFAIGMGLAVLRAELEAGRAARSLPAALGRRPLGCVALSFALFAVAAPMQHGDLVLPWYGLLPHAAIGLGSGLLVLAVIVPRPQRRESWLVRVLSHPLIAWIGTISYGVYLWHLPVLDLISPHLLPARGSGSVDAVVLTWVLVTAGAAACGAASWYLVERPLQRFSGSRGGDQRAFRMPGRVAEIDAVVQSTIDPLNSSGVAADHLA